MVPPAVLLIVMLFYAVVGLALAACIAVWTIAITRWRRRLPVLPYQPRRPVPWRGLDVGVIVLVYVLTPPLISHAAHRWLGEQPRAAAAAAAPAHDAKKTEHPLARVLQARPGVWVVLVCVLLAVVLAPLTEELVFRLLIQGWLERLERQLRRRMVLFRLTAGFLPVTAVALLFAAMHYREAEELPVTAIIFGLIITAIGSAVTVAALIGWLKFVAGATLADFGIVRGKLWADVKLGLIAFLAVMPLVQAVGITAKLLLPKDVVIDPIAIGVLALALGTLYYRTHRILPGIVLHVAFNTMGVVTALALP
ncbi:MAG: CPBP family glutamic-type intramembrane protease [Thermoguttaceae bacterium]